MKQAEAKSRIKFYRLNAKDRNQEAAARKHFGNLALNSCILLFNFIAGLHIIAPQANDCETLEILLGPLDHPLLTPVAQK